MKTRTSQNGIAGLMSRLLHNIKSAALALAALALAAPPAWGATKVWKDGVSGKISAASSWQDNAAWPTGGNSTRFGNTKGGIAKVENDYSMTTGNKMTDFFVQDGDFEITATKTIYHNNFYLINGGNSDFAPGTRASVLKKGDWTCIGYEFILGGKSGVTVAFTNQTGNCADIGKSRTAADRIPFQVAGWGSSTKTAPASPYSNIYAEFVVNDGSVTVAGCGNAGIACASDSTGRIIINGGTMTSPTNFVGWGAGSTGSIAVNGGTLSAKVLYLGCGADANASFSLNNGTVNASDHVMLGWKAGVVTTNYFEVAGGDFSQTAASKHLYIGSEGAAGTKAEVCAKGNGKMNISRSIILGNKVGGTLTVMDDAQVTLGTKTADGHVNMCYASTYNGDPSYLNLDGGTLTAKYITYGSGTSGNAFVTFNGGTLKANQASTTFIDNKARLFAKVAAGGGTIDSAGFAITIPAALTSGVAAGETDGGMTFKGGSTITLSGANTYTGATVIDAGTTLQMPAANNLAGNIVVTNATLADCPITVLTLTGAGADASDILSRCSLAADAPDTVELTVDGASVMVAAKAGQPTTARLIYDSGTDSWNWEFRDVTDAVVPSVNQSALEAGSVTVIFGSTAELAAIGTAPAWVGGWQMASTFTFDPSASASLPAEYTFDAGTVIDLKGCNWTLPDGLKSATAAFTVTNSVDATKAVLTVDVASGATYTETHLTLGGNLELRKTGAGTYAMTKDQPHTGGTVVTAGTMTRAGTVTVGIVAGSSQSLSVEGGSLTTSNSGSLVVGANGVGEFTITNATAAVNNLQIGNGTGSGTMNINGGQVTVSGWSYLANSATSGGAVLNLNGGTLATRRINVGTTADSLILFNGGTLYINGLTDAGFTLGTSNGATPEHLTIAVGENGGTIKTTNNDDKVKVCAGIVKADGVETDGGLLIEGGGKLTVTGSLSYTGGTTVEIGTTLVIPDTSLGGGLSVIFPDSFASAGVYTLVTTMGASEFSAADLPDVSAHPFYRAKLSADGKSIQIERVSPSMTVTALNQTTGEATIAFECIDAPLSLVVAWGEKDYGNTLTSWPYNKRAILATAVAAGTTSATYTLPEDARSAGTYWRMFLGDEAVTPYDEEVEWIQPVAPGAYIETDFTPVQYPKFELKANFTDNVIESGCNYGSILDAGTVSGNSLWIFCNAGSSFTIGARRGGYAYFTGFSSSIDYTIQGEWATSSKALVINDTAKTHNNLNPANGFSGVASDAKLRFWGGFKGKAGTDNVPFGASAYRFFYSKWWNSGSTLQAYFIPVKKGSEYGLYDIVAKKLYLNSGAQGTSFKGGAKVTDYTPVYFANGQLQASNPRMMGTIELVSRDWERPQEHVTLEWSASSVATKLWVAYSTEPISAAPGEFADPSAWSFCTNIASVAANGTTGTYTLGDPLGDGNRYRSMRFVLATGGSTESNLVPLVVSEPYRTLKQGTAIYLR